MSSKAFVNINTGEFLLHVSNLRDSNILATPKIELNNQDFLFAWGFFPFLWRGVKHSERSHSLFSSSKLIRIK